jgi:carboxymethylenebutenolidase
MCYEPDAVPPIEPIAGASTRQHPLTLTAADGNQFLAFEAFADQPSESAVVVLPDVRGLHNFYQELAVRLAEAGHDALAIDYFGRSAGLTGRGEDFLYQDHVPKVTWAGLTSDVAAAVARLRESNPDRKVFTLGFCFGGSNSWQQAAAGHRLTGAIGFYGHAGRVRPEGARPATELAGQMEGAILALMGGDDPGIPPEVTEAFEDALSKAGVPHQIVTYPGAPHSFFDRKYQEFADESADAWSRVLNFISDPPQG